MFSWLVVFAIHAPPVDWRVEQVIITGAADDTVAAIRPLLVKRVGTRFSPNAVRADLRALNATGLFADVRIEERAHSKLIYRVVEHERVIEVGIDTPGRWGSWPTVDDLLIDQLGKPLNAEPLNAVLQTVQQAARELGFASARLWLETKPLGHKSVGLIVHLALGRQLSIASINFRGTVVGSEDELSKVLISKIGEPPFRLDIECARILSWYYDRGMVNASVELQIQPEEDTEDPNVTFAINEGDVYRLGKLQVTGLELGPGSALLPLFEIKPGDTFSRSALSTGMHKLEALGRDRGLAVAITSEAFVDEAARTIDVAFKVSKTTP